uniref:Uncharacterized protein n=1 Tax=Chromera velia CCMP2878 TaxID=1169474 RepID=A0A0G4GRU0_9ALVE|mmetsp:Transcript_39248/g.77230  ORF Transcript_39248/g.77230 Transcript_39248/m.77230 type:complete len:479 (+) Transcript_39248:166-1602(+)|eukprot:Cvel_23106.t1-p1 / transcript=Cvel_23106.t1 / gene=Cvel_23106 / organism=Chromera_velia_CCMP2878 / gene_product=Uncharacterized 31.7 kDa protein in traX-finO, putative / transcript_product=Uncharacterized 31.7 kDa protein in traX-finO, putative / location=Cvel_scaffold2345:6613-11446(-) / protein_length=478 / sequence_SO=supercontig / SO=protein_coding / is_pseudo=false
MPPKEDKELRQRKGKAEGEVPQTGEDSPSAGKSKSQAKGGSIYNDIFLFKALGLRDWGIFWFIISCLLLLFAWRPIDQMAGFDEFKWVRNEVNDMGEVKLPGGIIRRGLRFPSSVSTGGEELFAWLYSPADPEKNFKGMPKPPIVVTSGGLGTQIQGFMERSSERLVKGGMAVLAFDYRNFGGSDGEPRHLVDPELQLEDWMDAVAFARSSEEVGGVADTSKLILYGTSLSGAHVLAVAAKLGREGGEGAAPSAVLSLVPYIEQLDGYGIMTFIKERGWHASGRLFWAALSGMFRDGLRRLTGGAVAPSEVQIRLMAVQPGLSFLEGCGSACDILEDLRHGKLADDALNADLGLMMRTPEEAAFYVSRVDSRTSLEKVHGGWRNWTPARSLYYLSKYKPSKLLEGLKSPVFIQSAREDDVCPPERHREIAARLSAVGELGALGVRHVEWSGGHWSVYIGWLFDRVWEDFFDFLKEKVN